MALFSVQIQRNQIYLRKTIQKIIKKVIKANTLTKNDTWELWKCIFSLATESTEEVEGGNFPHTLPTYLLLPSKLFWWINAFEYRLLQNVRFKIRAIDNIQVERSNHNMIGSLMRSSISDIYDIRCSSFYSWHSLFWR